MSPLRRRRRALAAALVAAVVIVLVVKVAFTSHVDDASSSPIPPILPPLPSSPSIASSPLPPLSASIARFNPEDDEVDDKKRSFAVVVLTSLTSQAQDHRQTERNRVLAALCQGDNLALLQQHRFTLYISLDSPAFSSSSSSASVPPLALPPACAALRITQIRPVPEPTSKTHPFAQTPTGRISRHYKFALAHVFHRHTHAIVLEDDLLPSPDFVALFVPPSPAFRLLVTRPDRVWCISSWNDMGHASLATQTSRLFRTDFFPGLGWMMTQQMFRRVMLARWPNAATTGWDNWLRANNDLQRECVVPEVNRVQHISSKGVNVQSASEYQVYAFSNNNASPSPPSWELDVDLERNDAATLSRVRAAHRVSNVHDIVDNQQQGNDDVVLVYDRKDLQQVLTAAGCLVPMRNEPRAGLRGLITLRRRHHHGGPGFLYLCDRVQCAPRVFPLEVFFPPTVRTVRADRAQSCDQACAQHKLRCDNVNLQSLLLHGGGGGGCAVLRTHFECANGCGHQVGPDLPAMASNWRLDTHGQCLLGESALPLCAASHADTLRVCSCVE